MNNSLKTHNTMTTANLSFLHTHGFKTQVGDFSHFHFVGAPFYCPQEKKQKPKAQPLPRKHIKIQFNPSQIVDTFDWNLLDVSPETLQTIVRVKRVVDHVPFTYKLVRIFPTPRQTAQENIDDKIDLIAPPVEELLVIGNVEPNPGPFSLDKHIKAQEKINAGGLLERTDLKTFINHLDQAFNKQALTFTSDSVLKREVEPTEWKSQISVKLDEVYESEGTGMTKLKSQENAIWKLLLDNELNAVWKLNLKPWMQDWKRKIDEHHLNHSTPKLQMNQGLEKEDTKRNSKRYQSQSHDRLERLSNSHPEIARDLKAKAAHIQLTKRQNAQFRQQLKALQRPELQFKFSVPVEISFESFNSLFERFIASLPPEVKKIMQWADLGASVWVLFFDTCIAAKYLACRTIYKLLGLGAMSLSIFTALVFQVMRIIGFVDSPLPSLNTFARQSPLAILMTLVLTFLFRKQPSKSRVEAALVNLKDLPLASSGIELLISVFEKGIQYVRNLFVTEETIESQIEHITKRVKYYLSVEGSKKIDLNLNAFVELSELQQKSIELLSLFHYSSVERIGFMPVYLQLNQLYRRAQLTPVAGHAHRKRPVVTHIYGAAGIGKSRMVNLIAADTIGTILTLDGETGTSLNEKVANFEKYIYMSPTGLKFEQNFNSHYSRIYVCDDANQVDPSFKTDDIPFPVKLISLNNSHDHMLPVAEVDQKKDARFNAALIIATDNQALPDLKYLASAAAYQRRLDFSLECKLLPEYSKRIKAGDKELYVVDESKLDLSKPNTHIYQFVDNVTQETFSYSQFILKVVQLLRQVHTQHSSDVQMFRNYALTSLAKNNQYEIIQTALNANPESQDVLESKLPQISELTDEHLDKLILETKADVHFSLNSDYFKTTPPPKLQSSESLMVEESDEQAELYRVRMCSPWKVRMVNILLGIVSFKYVRRVKKIFTKPKEHKSLLLFLTAFSLMVTGYIAYNIFSTKKPKKKEKRRHAEIFNYNNGDATKSKSRPQPSRNAPYKARRMHGSDAAEKEIITDLAAFSNSANLEVASSLSYAVQKIMCSNAYLAQLIYINAEGERRGRILRGFFVRGSQFIVNRHFVTLTPEEWKTGVINLYNIFTTKTNIQTSKVKVYEMEQDDTEGNAQHGFYDVVCIDFGSTVHTHVDLTRLANNIFLKEEAFSNLKHRKCAVFTIMVNAQFIDDPAEPLKLTGKTAWYAEIQHTRIKDVLQEAMEATDGTGNVVYTYKTLEYEMQGVDGYCGSIVIMTDPEYGGSAVAIHMAGFCNNDTSYGQTLPREMIDCLLPGLQVSLHKNLKESPRTLLDTTQFSVIKVIDHHLRAPTRSKIRKSIIHGKISQSLKKPAVLGMFGDQHVVNKAMLKYTGPSVGVTQNQEMIFMSILNYRFRPTRPINHFSRAIAIVGIEGNHFVYALNRSSSAGYPLNVETKMKGKTEYCGEGSKFITDHPRVMKLLDDYERKVEEGERPECYFVTTNKDELLLLKKVEEGRSRCFAAAPLHFSILIRQNYLDLVANMMENRIQNSSLVGVNAYSPEWDYAAQTLTRIAHPKSKQFLAGDFSNFDGSLNRDLLWMIYHFMEDCYGRSNNKLTEALWRDLVESQQVFGNAVVHITRGHPSGHPMTAIVNTLYNAGLTYLALYDILEEVGSVEAFSIQNDLWSHYAPLFYGDDNCMAFSRKLCDVVNPEMLPIVMKRLGHDYTTDAKDGALFEYKTMAEISILKRRFAQYDGVWYAPLEVSSIMEPLNWDKIPSSEFGLKRAQMETNARGAIRELAFHPAEVFQEWRDKIITVCREHDLVLQPDCYYNQALLRKMLKRGDNVSYLHTDDGFVEPALDFSSGVLLAQTNEEKSRRKSNSIRIHGGNHYDGSPIQAFQTTPLLQTRPTLQGNERTSTTQDTNTASTMKNTLSAGDQKLAPVGDIPFIDIAKDENLSGQQIISFSTELTPEVESIPEPADLTNDILSTISETREHSIHDILCREYAVIDGTIPTGGSVSDILLNIDPLALLLQQTNVVQKLSKFALFRANIKIRIELTAPPTVGGSIMANIFPDLYVTAITNRLLSRLQRSQAPRQEILLSTVKTIYLDLPWISPFYARNLSTGTGSIGRFVLSRITTSNTSDITYKVYIQCDPQSLKIEYPTFSSISLTSEQFAEYIDKLKAEFAFSVKKLNWQTVEKKKFSTLSLHQQQQVEESIVRVQGHDFFTGILFRDKKVNLNLFSDSQLEDILAGNVIDITAPDFELNPHDLEQGRVAKRRPRLQVKEAVQQERKGKISGMLEVGSKIATVASGLPVIGSVAMAATPILSLGAKIAGLFGFSKTIAEKPVRAVRWKPADSHLPNEGVLPSHSFAMTGSTTVETVNGQFGSMLDEMAVEYIERSTAIINDFRVSTSTPPNTVVMAIPCTVAQYEQSGNDLFFTHQAWIANAMQNWMGSMIFDFDFTGNDFHFVKLRISFNPNDTGLYSIGNVIPLDQLNTVKSKVVTFGGDTPNNSIIIEPIATTAMKWVPSTRDANAVATVATYDANRRSEPCSMGMIYVTVEVPLRATTTIVAQYVDFYTTFSMENLQLSNPSVNLPFAPRLQVKELPKLQVLQSNIGTNFNKFSRSERMGFKSSSMVSSNATSSDGYDGIKLSMGDKLHSIKNLLNAYYVFGPTLSIQAAQVAMIFPYCVRTTESQTTQQRFRNNDCFDYFAVGFGFYKGSMNIRLAKVDASLPLGEVFLQDPRNNLVAPTFSPNIKANQVTGVALATVAGAARSGARAIPLFAEECTPDLNIPYYSGFHCNRVSTDNTTSFQDGRLDQRLIIKPFTTQQYRIYRAVGDDFHFGTLTALPPFVLDTLSILAA